MIFLLLTIQPLLQFCYNTGIGTYYFLKIVLLQIVIFLKANTFSLPRI